jgi:hypothetical protein
MKGIESFALLVIAMIVACGPPPRQGGGDDDNHGTDASTVGDGDNGCADGTELVYVIDQFSARLSQFDPSTKTFQDLGYLNCPAMSGATTFSMSVDRTGTAWVLYSSGELFRVAILNGLACTSTAWHGATGLSVFGMGFSTDEPGGSTETLYVGGGLTQVQSSYTLAKIDTTTMSATPLGTETQLPEMTGTGAAELWGYMPEATTARIVKFDRTNGSILQTFTEPTLGGTDTGYAFAQWGGDYWVFLIRSGEPSTSVYQVDGMTGAIKSTTPTTGRTVVGAGVSTCAPTVIL